MCVIFYGNTCPNRSTAPADLSQGLDRTVTRVWDPMTFRRLTSWLLVCFQDLLYSILDMVGSIPVSVLWKSKSAVLHDPLNMVEIIQSPSISPGPMLVLLVTSVLFVL
jgi:hypothetical protein